MKIGKTQYRWLSTLAERERGYTIPALAEKLAPKDRPWSGRAAIRWGRKMLKNLQASGLVRIRVRPRIEQWHVFITEKGREELNARVRP